MGVRKRLFSMVTIDKMIGFESDGKKHQRCLGWLLPKLRSDFAQSVLMSNGLNYCRISLHLQLHGD